MGSRPGPNYGIINLEAAIFRTLIRTIRLYHSYTVHVSRTGLPDTIARFRNRDGQSIVISLASSPGSRLAQLKQYTATTLSRHESFHLLYHTTFDQ
jgi:hypothetical protein